MPKYFTPEEVSVHNCGEDCWVIVYDNVYDLTALVSANPGELAQPILKNAGMSVSHWFNKATRDVKTYVDPIKNIVMPFLPEGRFLHVPPEDPQPWSTASYENPWWKDEKFIIGKVRCYYIVLYMFLRFGNNVLILCFINFQLTATKRLIKIVNMLTKSNDIVYVCDEESIDGIRERYLGDFTLFPILSHIVCEFSIFLRVVILLPRI